MQMIVQEQSGELHMTSSTQFHKKICLRNQDNSHILMTDFHC